MEGTNNEFEAFNAFLESGCEPHYVHLNQLKRREVSLEDFSGLFLPGGFSAGDYIRAGAIFANRLRNSSFIDLVNFIDSGKPVIGVCNGFQILSEMGFLPGLDKKRAIALDHNDSNRYECRFTYIRRTSKSPVFRNNLKLNNPYVVPVAHAEGKIRFDAESTLEKLIDSGQVLFKYSTPDGLDGDYPWNPNGTTESISGLSNTEGNVIGLMPHPERLMDDNIRYSGNHGETTIGKAFFSDLKDYMSAF
jgi:phosphoribosylformylglycinamidine synthase